MNDLESLVRDALSDDRRRVAPPHDATGWVGTAVRRQRRKHAAVGLAMASVVALVGATLVVPFLSDGNATYVAGRPDAASGLLPWEPAGALVEETDVVASALKAWGRLADDEPVGDVYLVAGERWGGTEMVLLQAQTDSGATSLALLTTADGAAGPWALKDTAGLPSDSDVQALVLPAETIPRDATPRGSGPGSPTSLVLGPQWRVGEMRELAPSVGSQLVPETVGFGQEPGWQPVDRVSGYGWWAPLTMSSPDALPPSTVVLDHTGHGYADVAPVLEVDSSAGLSALTPSDVSFRLLPGEQASVEALDTIDAVVQRLGLTEPVKVTMLDWGSGATWLGRKQPPDTTHLFAQFDTPDARHPLLVAYATTGGEVDCLTKRRVPAADVTSLSFVGMACQFPIGGAPRGLQGNVLYARSFIDEPDLKDSVLDFTVTLVRPNGQSTTTDLSSNIGGYVQGEASKPVRRYVFVATEIFDGGELEPWIWPAYRPTG